MGRPSTRSPDEKLQVVLAVVRGELTVAEASRRERRSETSIAKWRDLFLEGRRRALVHGAGASYSAGEIALRDENEELKRALGEAFAESRVLRKGGPYLLSFGCSRSAATSPNQTSTSSRRQTLNPVSDS